MRAISTVRGMTGRQANGLRLDCGVARDPMDRADCRGAAPAMPGKTTNAASGRRSVALCAWRSAPTRLFDQARGLAKNLIEGA